MVFFLFQIAQAPKIYRPDKKFEAKGCVDLSVGFFSISYTEHDTGQKAQIRYKSYFPYPRLCA